MVATNFATLSDGLQQMSLFDQAFAQCMPYSIGDPWVDITSPPFNAKGDGVTDNTTAVAQAVAAINALGGGTVYFPPGNFYVAGSITDGTTAVRFVGASEGSAQNAASTAAVQVTGTTVQVGVNAVSVFNLSNLRSSLINLNILGQNAIGATVPAVTLASVEGLIRDCRVKFGSSCISVTGGDAVLDNLKVYLAYGPTVIDCPRGAYLRRCKVDQSGTKETWVAPSLGTTFSPWAATTSYSLNTVVSLSGWLMQCQSAGTSGGTAPALQPYTIVFPDGTATWRIVAPTTFTGINIGAQTYAEQCDFSGAYSSAVTVSSGVNFSRLTDCTFSGIQTGILATASGGEGLLIEQCNISSFVSPTAVGVQIGPSFAGGVSIRSTFIQQAQTAVSIGGGTNNKVADCFLYPGGATSSVGVSVAAGVTDFDVGYTSFNSAAHGAMATAIKVATGSSDRYTIAFNKVFGCSTGVSDGGSGSNKYVAENF